MMTKSNLVFWLVRRCIFQMEWSSEMNSSNDMHVLVDIYHLGVKFQHNVKYLASIFIAAGVEVGPDFLSTLI